MFDWLKRLGDEAPGLGRLTQELSEMLEDGRHIFDAAANALLGGTDPETIRADLFETDRRINSTEQRMRRELVVHGTVFGAGSFPALLVLMSVGKDAERIGDYAKNLFDLADRAARDPAVMLAGERAELVRLKDAISRLLVRAKHLFEEQDTAGARSFLVEVDRLEDACDDAVERLIAPAGPNAAATVLAYRYFKRVTSHAGNIVTSVVVPLDKLDFFDEPRGAAG